jgi:hypothetical protein
MGLERSNKSHSGEAIMSDANNKPSCFVVMGYGKKTDFHQNRTFDLDKSYKYIIKPAVQDAGYECIRADEIQHAGNINVPMYDQLLNADLVIADLSTTNPNAFFELGVRYALKPRTTIVIAEEGFKRNIPFDMGQVVIRGYEHLGEGIDYGEVERMRKELTTACKQIVEGNQPDSPVYTFIANLAPPTLKLAEIAVAEERRSAAETDQAIAQTASEYEKDALTKPFAVLMQAALKARESGDFKTMRAILAGVRAAQGDKPDPFVVQQLALATYKSQDLDPHQRLLDARTILAPLDPEASSDPETLGIWGAIHKRLTELPQVPGAECSEALDRAIWAYEKGFYLKNDYYNGINFAFLLDVRASRSSDDEATADRVQARRVRRRVLTICEDLLTHGIKGESQSSKAEQEYWIRATMVEAFFGLGRGDEADAAFHQAETMKPKPEAWMVESTTEQIDKLRILLKASAIAPPA